MEREKFFIGPPPLGEKGFYDFMAVSMSLGKRVFSKVAHRIFLKFLMKLECLNCKKLTEPDFWKNFILGIMSKILFSS